MFTSRYLHPALGFVGNAGYFVATVPMFIGITITTIETFGFSSLFAYWGLAYHSQSYLNLAGTYQNTGYEFTIGAVATILFALLPFFGYRLYKALNRVILPLIILGVIVMFGILAFTSQSTAWAHLDALTAPFGNATFAQSINATHPAPVTNFSGTLALNGIYVVGFSYIISAIYVAGEVKQVQRNMPLAILGTLLITFVMFAGGTLLLYHALGYGFLANAYTTTVVNFGTLSPLPAAFVPYINFFAAAISGNPYLGSFIIIVSLLQLLWYQTNAVFIGSRLLLSYSFDKIMPGFMGDVSTRFHVPAKGMIVSLIIGLIAGAFFCTSERGECSFCAIYCGRCHNHNLPDYGTGNCHDNIQGEAQDGVPTIGRCEDISGWRRVLVCRNLHNRVRPFHILSVPNKPRGIRGSGVGSWIRVHFHSDRDSFRHILCIQAHQR